MKNMTASLIALAFALPCAAQAEQHLHHHGADHGTFMVDERIPLNMTPQNKLRQLQNMRSHLAAVQDITGLLAGGDFGQAAAVARSKLGLSPEMETMCRAMSGNQDFVRMALAFHHNGNELGDILQRGNLKESLDALHTTLGHCVQCHATFRQ